MTIGSGDRTIQTAIDADPQTLSAPRISREIAEGSISSTTSVRNRFYDYIDPHAVSAVNDYRSSSWASIFTIASPRPDDEPSRGPFFLSSSNPCAFSFALEIGTLD